MCNCCISPGVAAARRSKVGQPHSHLSHMYRVQARSAHQLCLKQLCLTSLVSPAKSIPIDAEPGSGTTPAIVSVAPARRPAERRCDVGQPHSRFRLCHMYRAQALSAYQGCWKQLCLTSLLSPTKSIPLDPEPGSGTMPAIVSVAPAMRPAERRWDVGQPHSRLSHMYRAQALSAYKLCLKQLRLTSLLSPAKSIPIDPEPGSGTMPAFVSLAPAMRQCCRCATAALHRRGDLGPALCRVSNSLQTCAVAPPLTPD